MRLENSYQQLDGLREAWDTAAMELGGSVYMSYDWTKTWWEFYGAKKEIRLFLFYAGEKIVGIVPTYIDTLTFGPMRFRIARLVGSNIPPKVFNPPIHEVWGEKILQEVSTHLLEKDNCDVLSLGPVSETQNWLGSVDKFSSQPPKGIGKIEVIEGVHSIFWFPANMEDYYAALSKNERKNRRKYELRLLKKEFEDTRIEVISDASKVEEEFEHFAKQHATQWRAEGKTGHFGAWPNALAYNRALVKAQGKLGRMRFIRIVAKNQVIANQYTFAFGDTYYWELPSREVDPEWERFSLGPTGIVTMIDVGIQEGKARLEGGLAHYDYKIRLGAKEHKVKTIRIASGRPESQRRLKVFSLLRRAVELAYHKIWYRRIAPKLPPSFWKPQWMLWLRLDF